MAVGQTTATNTTILGIHYDRKFLEWEKNRLRMKQFAQERPLPTGGGKVAYFTGYRPAAIVTTALTEQTNPTAGYFESRRISATVAEWGDTKQIGKLLELTKLDPGLMEQTRIMADQAARTLDYQITREVVRNGIWGITTSGVATDTRTVTVVSSASNSTSVFVATDHSSAGGSAGSGWVGAIATVISDTTTTQAGKTIKYGHAGRIGTYVSDMQDVFTLNTTAPHAAAPEAFQSGDKVRLVAQTDLAATNILTTTYVGLAQRDLINNLADPFGDGYYAAVLDPLTDADFKKDTTWVNAASYSGIDELYRGEVGRWFGFRFVITTQPGREDTNSTENRTGGAVHHNLFIGQNAFGHTELVGPNQRLMYTVQGSDKTDPLDMYSIVGWKQIFANKALTAPWCVSVLTGATA